MNKVHVIVNPLSARGKTRKRWETLKEVIRHHFKEYKYIFTEKPRQATEMAREFLKEGFDLIIGVGGDGTLNEITNGFFREDSHRAINEDASLGIVPSGTGSDFIKFLRIPREFDRSVALIKNSGTRKLDVGRVTFNDPGQGSTRRYFINVADFGLGAEVINNISAIPAEKRNAFFYYKGLLSTIRTYKSKKVKIVVDDSEEIEGSYLIGAVANGRMFGGGMIIAPQAEPDDGCFDFVLIEEMKRFEVIRNSILLFNGKILNHPKVTQRRAKKIKVYSDEEVKIETDGETGVCLPAEFEIIEKGVNFRI
ncbi:MAG: diacylglycerol kinase family lipid kinase [Candidatus Aminicenantes bacterium]|nr:diacylglycerol kinase family lipid kinase [Candidatus Aminicenantes bacterium]